MSIFKKKIKGVNIFYKLFVHLFYTCSKIVALRKKEHLIFYTFGYKNLGFFVKYVTFWALRQQYSMDIHKFLKQASV